MSSEKFEGRSGEMRTSEYLAKEDIQGCGDVELTIDEVLRERNVAMDAGRKVDTLYSLVFTGKAKRMIINSTNRKTLVKLFGVNVKEWKGQKIKLFVDERVKMKGQVVGGIRVRGK